MNFIYDLTSFSRPSLKRRPPPKSDRCPAVPHSVTATLHIRYLREPLEIPNEQSFLDKTGPHQEENLQGNWDHVEEATEIIAEDDEESDKGLEEA